MQTKTKMTGKYDITPAKQKQMIQNYTKTFLSVVSLTKLTLAKKS